MKTNLQKSVITLRRALQLLEACAAEQKPASPVLDDLSGAITNLCALCFDVSKAVRTEAEEARP